MPCARMILTAACATRWWPKKFSSKLSRSTASSTSPIRPCQAAPAFETTMSTPPKAAATCGEGGAHRRGIGDVAAQSQRRAADRLCLCLRGGLVDIEQRHFGAGRGERLGGGRTDGAGGAGDRRDLAGQRQLLGAAELGLLQRPVFDVEQIGLRQRLEAADRLGVGDGFDRGLGEVGGDPRVLLAAAESEQADPGHQHHARRRIEHGLDAADARIVAAEIVPVALAVGRDGAAHLRLEPGEVARLGGGDDQRPVLDADVVVGRHHAGLAVARRPRRR